MGKSSCCCGATPSKPCLCMKQDVMSCSAKAPMCPCYKALAEKKGADWTMLDEMGLYGKTSGCVGCQMHKPVSEKERVAIQKQVNKFNEQLALDPDDDFERYILLDLDDENLIEDAFFSRQTWKPLTEAFRKRWGERSELMDKISIAQVGEKSNWSIYSFEKPFWFEYETDPQDTATAEDPEGYGLGFEFDMTKEEAIEKARQIHKETKGAITMYNTARKRSGGGSTRIHPKFWATPEMMEEQKDYYKREGMKWPTGDDLVPYNFNAEYHRDSKGRFTEKPLLTGSVVGGLALGLMYFMGRK